MKRLGPALGAPVVRWRRLGGGLAADTSSVTLGDGREVVVKRYKTAVDEWACLSFAAGVDVPSPEPIALDEAGKWFDDGVPVLVMSSMPGVTLLRPTSLDDWLGQLARTLAAIHDADISSVRAAPDGAALLRPVGSWDPPPGVLSSPLVDAATEILASVAPPSTAREVLMHNDFHPGNLLWRRQRLSGVLDWAHARLGPRDGDVACCRIDLAMLHGQRAADRFAAAYRSETGCDLHDLPVWDLHHALRGIARGRLWVGGYAAQGLRDLPTDVAMRRIRAFARRALLRLT